MLASSYPSRRTASSRQEDVSPNARCGAFVAVHKPIGFTSYDVVSLLRGRLRKFGINKVGHSGTLDPFAEGVLLCAIGFATKLLPWSRPLTKVYRAHICLGVETDTCDRKGTVTAQCTDLDKLRGLTRETIERVLHESFTGDIVQQPPIYSAVKVHGMPSYRLARQMTRRLVASKQEAAEEEEIPAASEATASRAPVLPALEDSLTSRVAREVQDAIRIRERVSHVHDIRLIDVRHETEASVMGDRHTRGVDQNEDDGMAGAMPRQPHDQDATSDGANHMHRPYRGRHRRRHERDADADEEVFDADDDALGVPTSAYVNTVSVWLDITCGPGTYVRTIAKDLGVALGVVGGHTRRLVRMQNGRFDVRDCLTITGIRNADISLRPYASPARASTADAGGGDDGFSALQLSIVTDASAIAPVEQHWAHMPGHERDSPPSPAPSTSAPPLWDHAIGIREALCQADYAKKLGRRRGHPLYADYESNIDCETLPELTLPDDLVLRLLFNKTIVVDRHDIRSSDLSDTAIAAFDERGVLVAIVEECAQQHAPLAARQRVAVRPLRIFSALHAHALVRGSSSHRSRTTTPPTRRRSGYGDDGQRWQR